MNEKKILHSLTEMQDFARDFVQTLSPQQTGATVLGLYGDLGAGKTSFTQGLAQALGVSDTVVSPTFVIMKVYKTRDMTFEIRENSNAFFISRISNLVSRFFNISYLKSQISVFTHLIHIDAYRIERPEEMLRLGWNDIISNKENLVIVEWPERIGANMPEHIKIKFEHITENEREVEVTQI